MAEIRKLDSRRRVVFPEQFSPGDLFIEESITPEEVTFRLIEPREVALKKAIKKNGHFMIRASFDSKKIAQAVRDDRDAR